VLVLPDDGCLDIDGSAMFWLTVGYTVQHTFYTSADS